MSLGLGRKRAEKGAVGWLHKKSCRGLLKVFVGFLLCFLGVF